MLARCASSRHRAAAQSELVELFTDAFTEQGLLPGMPHRKASLRSLMNAFLRFYSSSDSLALHGIRRSGRIVCGAATVNSGEEVSLRSAALFFFRIARALGWRTAASVGAIEQHQPKLDQRHLELVLLGTAPSHQGQGLGGQMVDFLCREVERLDCSGAVLVTDPATPAFSLYRSRGFVVESRFPFATGELAWMRWSQAG